MKKFRHYALLLVTAITVFGCSKDHDETNSTPKVEIEKVELNQTTLNLNVGEEKMLTVTITPSDANQTVAWESSNEAVATVKDGTVTGKTAGTATITATAKDGGKTATCAVTVSNPKVEIEKVELNQTTLNLNVGDEKTLTVTVTPSDANQTVTWKSSNETVATVKDGTVTGKTAGTATITATAQDGGKTATCAVTVEEKGIIGNFYYSDGTHSTEKVSEKTVVGIIFWEDPNNEGHGKIVSLDETLIAWSTENIQTDARDENNGVNNMSTIKALNSDYSKYPAFKWCTDKGSINGKTWYYPSIGDLKLIQQQISKVNNSLGAVDTKIDFGHVFSSSTESTEFGGKNFCTDLTFSSSTTSVGAKSMAFYVRAILAF